MLILLEFVLTVNLYGCLNCLMLHGPVGGPYRSVVIQSPYKICQQTNFAITCGSCQPDVIRPMMTRQLVCFHRQEFKKKRKCAIDLSFYICLSFESHPEEKESVNCKCNSRPYLFYISNETSLWRIKRADETFLPLVSKMFFLFLFI